MATKENEDTTIRNNIDDATQIVVHSSISSKEDEKTENEIITRASDDSINRHNTAKTVGGIAAGGVLIGTAAAVFMDMKGAPTTEFPETAEGLEENDIANEAVMLPEIIVEAISPGHKSAVYDGMTFEEAFSVARETMGPGSAFEWHGNVYATYTKEEWTEMSDDQKSDFYATLHIDNPFSSSEAVEVLQADMPYQTGEAIYADTELKPDETVNIQTFNQPEEEDTYGDDIPIVSVGNASEDENDIQILGVTQDISTGYNVGHLSVDGEEVVVIDVDGDMVFDSMVADLNHDGEITQEEIIDISQHSLSLDNLSGHSDIFVNPLSSSEDSPDYLSQIVE